MAAIRITASNTSSGDLTLQDSNGNSATNFNAQRGMVITWEIQPGSGVSSLTGFAQKQNVNGNSNVFSSYPAQQGNSSNWQGTVDPNLSSGSYSDSYEISWKDAQGNSYTYDPMIIVNPLPA